MSEYINRNSTYNKLANFFNCYVAEEMSRRLTKDEVLSIIMDEDSIDLSKELNDAHRDVTNYLIKELRTIIPVALWDKTAEELSADKCYSFWQYCLESIREMKDSWEAENGENLVWVPGHYEEVKDG